MPMNIDQLHEHRMQYYRHPISNVVSHNRVSIYHLWTYITNPLLYKQATDTLRGIADEKERKAFKAKEFDYILASGTFSSRNDQALQSALHRHRPHRLRTGGRPQAAIHTR